MAIGIPGVDEANFNNLFDGDEDLYKAVLTTFAENMPVSLAKLANPTKETLEDYRIRVHALKGACANICAEDLREKALYLEMKAKGGDLTGVQAGNGALIKEVEEMIEKVKAWLKSHQG